MFDIEIRITSTNEKMIPFLHSQYTNFLANIKKAADEITITDHTIPNAGKAIKIKNGIAVPGDPNAA